MLLDWIGRHDQKSSIVLGINTAMLGVLVATAPKADKLDPWMLLPVGLTVLGTGLGVFFAMFGNFPRTRGPADSMIYFGSIKNRTLDEYVQVAKNQADGAHVEDLARQVHRNAEILDGKFRSLRKAYLATFAAIPAWAASVAWFKLVGG